MRRGLASAAIVATALLAAGCGSDADPEPAVTIELPASEATEGATAKAAASERDDAARAADKSHSEDEPGVDAAPSADESSADDEPGVDAAPSAEPPEPETTLALETPPDAYPVIWVRRKHEVEIRTEPGGGELVERVGKRTEFSSPTVFGVVRQSGDWAGVSTPLLPNGQLGWVRLDPKRLAAGWTNASIVVDLSERRAELRAKDEVKRSFAVTIGAPGIETPTGRYAITDTFRGDLNPAYGCCALALSATQPKLPSGWLGGNRIAIHGTAGPLGVAASHGCIRAADTDVSALVKRVPLGTPVFIRS